MASSQDLGRAPGHRASSDHILSLVRDTPCPYAGRATLGSAIAWKDPEATRVRVARLAQELQRFIADKDGDVFVLEIQISQDLDITRMARLLNATLEGLRDRDGSDSRPLMTGISKSEWDFEFAGLAFFIAVFAPCYGANNPRWSGDDRRAFILFQPERSFRRFGISSKRANRHRLSSAIHRRFMERGQGYDLEFTIAKPKSMRYLKPLTAGDAPIRWWDLPSS